MQKEHNSSKNILVAFVLNLGFSIYEFIGGTLTHSVAIVSDAVHDMGDAFSIGVSYFLERKSKKEADDRYTYGYLRYSLLGGMITTLILLLGSFFVIYQAVLRLIDPVEIEYNGMIALAVVGVVVNSVAVYFTREGGSLNQRAVNLHMLEDVLGWVVVLIGAIIMRVTNFGLIDPLLSILVAGFILKEAIKNFLRILEVLLEKTPRGLDVEHLKEEIIKLPNVNDIHHLHIWSMDGEHNYATLHVIYERRELETKQEVKKVLQIEGIMHATVEMEKVGEKCMEEKCLTRELTSSIHHHH